MMHVMKSLQPTTAYQLDLECKVCTTKRFWRTKKSKVLCKKSSQKATDLDLLIQ